MARDPFALLARRGGLPWVAPPEPRPVAPRQLGDGAEALANATPIRDAHRVAWPVEFVANPANGASGVVLEQPSGIRNFLMLRNASATANIYVSFGRSAGAATSPIPLAPGDIVLFDTVCPQSEIHAVADAASAILCGASSVYGG